MMVGSQPSILFIDAYDSFSNNIISLLTTTLSCSVRVIHIDSPGFETDEALRDELRHYDAVVCGPGPGDPAKDKDVGIMKRLWELRDEDILPILGICLGFQSLCLAFGGHMRVLNEGLHGRVRRIQHIREADPSGNNGHHEDMFDGIGTLRATLYHSLHVATKQHSMSEEEWEAHKWQPIYDSGHLLPLAWTDSESRDKLNWKNDRILMAVRHDTKPFWGLQYHPESICTNKEGKAVIKNWFDLAQRWNRKNGRIIRRDEAGICGALPTLRSLLSRVEHRKTMRRLSNTTRKLCIDTIGLDCHYESRTIGLPDNVSVPDIVEKIQNMQRNHIMLESSNAYVEGVGVADVRGRYSIIGLDVDDALRIEYHSIDRYAYARKGHFQNASGLNEKISLTPYEGIWPFLADFLEKRKLSSGNPESPFWGGFMGYTAYELGLKGIGVKTSHARSRSRPDLCFAWITRSLVLDHLKKKIYIQHLVDDDCSSWLDDMESLLLSLNWRTRRRYSKSLSDIMETSTTRSTVVLPNQCNYESKVRACQEEIRKGESYELCLTDQTHITLPRRDISPRIKSCPQHPATKIAHDFTTTSLSHTTAWTLYKSLRRRNPAPFASFIRLGPATFISGSPERFLKWDSAGKCSLRPMKGTVKKTTSVSTGVGQASNLAQASALLQVPKEQAENLMIVDLVRHDLHGVCGPGNVTVPQLMVVEEYATVFQMISVVEGQIPPVLQEGKGKMPEEKEREIMTRYTGIDVLAASLPPGSMTGAPKKRSCELLQEIEGRRDRSLYSGVVGYMDVGQRGDFSVNIRCMFRWDDETCLSATATDQDEHQSSYESTGSDDGDSSESGGDMVTEGEGEGETEVWHIGAGGAVTALSLPVAEREEMQTKLAGTLGVFETVLEGLER
jgi:para-aminobenzoate synthetase